ncbi:MAG TPA: DUF1707 domain-containing protein [Solirubrobacteraceae bacterium]
MYENSTYTMSRDPNLRAGDADREAAGERLRHHHTEGRLDTDEFQERIDRCYQAKTVGELEQLLTDLPEPVGTSGARPRVRHLWSIPLAPILLAVVAISAVSGHGFWLLFPLFFLFRFLMWGRHGRPGMRWRREQQV